MFGGTLQKGRLTTLLYRPCEERLRRCNKLKAKITATQESKKKKEKKNQQKRYDFKWANKLYLEKTTAAMAEV